jgi:4-hydroxy-2-oxoheptanedioate aldolase
MGMHDMASEPRQIRPNRAKRKLKAGQPVFVPSWPAIDLDADGYENLGPLGVIDMAWIEAEHGRVTWRDFSDLSRACDLAGITSAVRVYQNEPGLIARVLDRGIQGVLVPHVKTKEEAERAVRSTFHQPLGHHSGGGRQVLGVADHLKSANDEIFLMVLIEDTEGIRNLPEILKVPGIDVFFIGPGDLGHSMGAKYSIETGKDWHFHPEVQKVVRDGLKQIAAAGKVSGTLVREDNVEEYLDMGVRFLRFAATAFITDGLRRFKAKVNDHLAVPASR